MQNLIVSHWHMMFVVKTLRQVIEVFNFAKDLWILEEEF